MVAANSSKMGSSVIEDKNRMGKKHDSRFSGFTQDAFNVDFGASARELICQPCSGLAKEACIMTKDNKTEVLYPVGRRAGL